MIRTALFNCEDGPRTYGALLVDSKFFFICEQEFNIKSNNFSKNTPNKKMFRWEHGSISPRPFGKFGGPIDQRTDQAKDGHEDT